MSLPSSEDWLQRCGTAAAFLVERGNGNGPDKHIPFNCQVFSKLRQLAAKHGLGSPAVANMLQFITTSELILFDMRQIIKLLCTPMECMMFEAAWRDLAVEQGLLNSEALQEDSCFGAGVSQLMGLRPTESP